MLSVPDVKLVKRRLGVDLLAVGDLRSWAEANADALAGVLEVLGKQGLELFDEMDLLLADLYPERFATPRDIRTVTAEDAKASSFPAYLEPPRAKKTRRKTSSS